MYRAEEEEEGWRLGSKSVFCLANISLFYSYSAGTMTFGQGRGTIPR